MIITRSVIDQIEIRPQENVVQLRIAKQIVDGDTVISEQWHRTTFDASTDVDLQMAAVNAHLALMGFAPVEDLSPLRQHVDLARTFALTAKRVDSVADTATAIVTP